MFVNDQTDRSGRHGSFKLLEENLFLFRKINGCQEWQQRNAVVFDDKFQQGVQSSRFIFEVAFGGPFFVESADFFNLGTHAMSFFQQPQPIKVDLTHGQVFFAVVVRVVVQQKRLVVQRDFNQIGMVQRNGSNADIQFAGGQVVDHFFGR